MSDITGAAFWWAMGALVSWSLWGAVTVFIGLYSVSGAIAMVVFVALGQYIAFKGGARWGARQMGWPG